MNVQKELEITNQKIQKIIKESKKLIAENPAGSNPPFALASIDIVSLIMLNSCELFEMIAKQYPEMQRLFDGIRQNCTNFKS
jgi:hypothetical protein